MGGLTYQQPLLQVDFAALQIQGLHADPQKLGLKNEFGQGYGHGTSWGSTDVKAV